MIISIIVSIGDRDVTSFVSKTGNELREICDTLYGFFCFYLLFLRNLFLRFFVSSQKKPPPFPGEVTINHWQALSPF